MLSAIDSRISLAFLPFNVAYQITKARPEASQEGSADNKAAQLFKEMIDKGKLGRETGQGFYTYDD